MDAPRARIESLEGLRGVAALVVVLYHLPIWHPVLAFGPLKNGHLMVDVFFVLSGYVITLAFSHTLRTPADLLHFQKLRLLRLYPVHLVMLGAFVAIECVKWLAQQYAGMSSPNSQPFRESSPQALLQHLLLVQAIGPGGHPLTFNVPAWSISVEFWTYLVFGATVLATGAWSRVAFAVISVGSVALLLSGLGNGGWNDLLRCLAGFFLGALLVWAQGWVRLPTVVGAIALVGVVALMVFSDGRMPARVMTMGLAALMVLTLINDNRLSRIFECAPLRTLGALSFSLYMCHTLVIWVANQVARLVLRGPDLLVHGVQTPQLPLWTAAIGWGLTIAGSLVMAELLRRFVEAPCRNLSRRLSRKRPAYREARAM